MAAGARKGMGGIGKGRLRLGVSSYGSLARAGQGKMQNQQVYAIVHGLA